MRKGILVLWILFACPLDGKDFLLFYLGGQSNMDGYGFVRDVPESLRTPMTDVRIFQSTSTPDGVQSDGLGIWDEMQPGHGVGFSSDGIRNVNSERFGVELTFADRMRKQNPGTGIAIIKYSRGGTSIDIEAARGFGCWDPDFSAGSGHNQYDHFLAALRQALSVRDIDGDGEDDRLIPAGIVWMQGESDADVTEAVAYRYESNLKRLMDLMRAALRMDDLPVVIGRISDSGRAGDGKVWKYGEILRKAQEEFAARDGFAVLVTSTDGYGYSDPWHYDSAGYLDLGIRFAEAFLQFRK